ncbi:MAG: hypothetical protein LBR95_02970 [Azoarcus sp.]|jgi:hypothetical protein|nr:hypothetical protein [Azoarcus sp.]
MDGKPVALLVDASLFARIRRMRECFDALAVGARREKQRLKANFAGTTTYNDRDLSNILASISYLDKQGADSERFGRMRYQCA